MADPTRDGAIGSVGQRRVTETGPLRGWWFAAGLLAVALLGCSRRTEVVVFCAASLQPVLTDAATEFSAAHPRIRVRIEPSGSLVAVRKVTELGMRADLVAVSDAVLLERMLIPGHASYSIEFAANEIVLAHRDHSRFTDQVTAANWPEVLLRDGVRLGCTDPDTAPLGYRTRFVWQLASARGAVASGGSATRRDLDAELSARCAAEHVVPDENELVALLEARAIDYAFLYRSTAESHHLKTTLLDPAINLSQPGLADRYATAEVKVGLTTTPGSDGDRFRGAPITYGITLVDSARHRGAALEFLAFLLDQGGRRHLERMGFTPLSPALAHHLEVVPAPLLPFLVAAP